MQLTLDPPDVPEPIIVIAIEPHADKGVRRELVQVSIPLREPREDAKIAPLPHPRDADVDAGMAEGGRRPAVELEDHLAERHALRLVVRGRKREVERVPLRHNRRVSIHENLIDHIEPPDVRRLELVVDEVLREGDDARAIDRL